MAAIEKVCEYSGEYPDWLMYGYKRNLIQVMPEYRKLFKGHAYTLYYWPDEIIYKYKWGGYQGMDHEDLDRFGRIDRSLPYQPTKGKLVQNYWYALVVPGLPGEVEGRYLNLSSDMKAVKHKLRKLLGLRGIGQLKIKKLPDRAAFNRIMEAEARDAIVEKWHQGGFGEGVLLHQALGMTEEEYAVWMRG